MSRPKTDHKFMRPLAYSGVLCNSRATRRVCSIRLRTTLADQTAASVRSGRLHREQPEPGKGRRCTSGWRGLAYAVGGCCFE